MNKIEALRKEADLREMCEGTKVNWWECMKGFAGNICLDHGYATQWLKTSDGTDIRYALAIVEGKPVFVGDALYCRDFQFSVDGIKDCKLTGVDCNAYAVAEVSPAICSWNPPKPKTVMVELLVEDAEFWATRYPTAYSRDSAVTQACRKALEEMKK